ncbi:MAG: (Fe-S)-binding protein [Candidatus Latescibacteria bacterium]|nr:(Fe-S)-binding protein [Candidatus Latescibacterota bacterium]
MADKKRLNILEKQIDEINRCFRCGLCKTVCPSYEELKIESASPRGRIQFAKSVLTAGRPLEGAIQARMLDCLNCMRCAEICPSEVRTDRIVLAARAELARKGKLNIIKKAVFKTVIRQPKLMNLGARIASYGQRWFYKGNEILEALIPRFAGMGDKHFPELSHKQALNKWPEINPPDSGKPVMRVGYFIGCATNLMFTGVADATIRVLTHNNIEVVIPRKQACCGIPVYSSGDYKTAKRLAKMNLEVFSGQNIDCIVTDCASCSAALKHEIKELLGVGPFDVPVYDLNEFLINVIKIDRDLGEVPMKVTYHDPCHLKRGQGIFREPRELLQMIPGVEFIEMKDADRCCGGAGTFSYTHHNLSRKVGSRKADSIRHTDARFVSTPCPSCKMQLDDLIYHEGIEARTIHPVEILDMSYMNKALSGGHKIVDCRSNKYDHSVMGEK